MDLFYKIRATKDVFADHFSTNNLHFIFLRKNSKMDSTNWAEVEYSHCLNSSTLACLQRIKITETTYKNTSDYKIKKHLS